METASNGDGGAAETARAGGATEAFAAAQRALFEAVGLETRSRFVDLETPRVRTRVVEAGPRNGEHPVVFVHGTGGFGAFLAPLMARLDDVPLLTFDRPEYGLSGEFTYTEGTIRETLVETIAGVLDEVGCERVDLVGHSMGGHAALRFALTHPGRVRRLVTLGALPGFPGTSPPLPLRLLTVPLLGRLVRRLQKPGEEGVHDIAEVFGEGDAITDHPAFVRAIAAHEADPKSVAAAVSEYNALLSLRGWRASVRLREDELRSIPRPTTLVWGANDPLGGPDAVREQVAWLPDARFEVVEAGHIPYLAHPARCAQLIRSARAAAATASE